MTLLARSRSEAANRRRALSVMIIAGGASLSFPALALDKQGSAHGGEVSSGEEPQGFDIEGAAMLGVSILNKSYAARPDNTGLALMRYAAHFDVDLVGRKLSIPIDLNFFTDKERKGLLVFAPTEFDFISGVVTTHSIAKGIDGELGGRFEFDLPVDRGGFSQKYADVRARGLYSLGQIWPGLARDLVDGDISGAFTLGWFAINPTYAARPDNTGRALFRYAAHTELSVWHDHVSLGFDATMFTDRRSNPIRPSELDATYEIIGRLGQYELHLAYERDMPLDTRSLVQDFVYALLVFDFDLKHDILRPVEERGTIVSP